MPETFFTSDTHFDHQPIIHLSKRPFESVSEMNETLIANWNAVVSPKDTVWHLGDFSMGSDQPASVFVNRLNGSIHLIEGNHDHKTVRDCAGSFASIDLMKTISLDNQRIILCHYPMREWNKAWRGSWHLFGHVHGRLDSEPFSKSMDVGVDSNHFRPLAFEKIRAFMQDQEDYPHFAGGEVRIWKK